MDVGELDNASNLITAEAPAASMATAAAAAAARSGEGGVALVAGATGLVGRELVRALLLPTSAWKLVYGVARRPPDDDDDHERYRFLTCDLLDRGETMEKLSPLAERVTDVFWVTWASQFPLDTQACCDQNRAMLSNALDALLLPVARPALAHLALQTGTMHYVSIKQQVATGGGGGGCHVYYEEESPRVGEEVHNFYYALEDLVKERLGGGGRRIASSSWSVHRPGLLLGSSRRSHFNLMGSLCVYASICRHLGLPFRFHGLRRCWAEPYMDASDARVVANQHLWWASVVSSSTTSSSSLSAAAAADHCQAFNAVNGTAFTWKEVWPALAAKFGLPLEADDEDDELVAEETIYSGVMADKGAAWEEIVAKESLRSSRMDDLANWAFLDMVFRFPAKILVSSGKARRLGFTTSYTALESLLYWVDRMREERLIPSY